MIGALLSNTPANLLRNSGVAGDLQPGAADGPANRDQDIARSGQGSAAAVAVRTGGVRTLTPQAVLTLQEVEDTRTDPGRQNDAQSPSATVQAEGSDEEQDEDPNAVAEAVDPSAVSGEEQLGQQDKEDPDGDGLNEAEEKQVQDLAQRDREVRAHEQAHARVGGQYASAPSYTFQQGPDGKRYAVGGEVQIDTAKERTPDATIRKMQIVIRAATAPAEPSSQDLKVAQQARSQLSEAQAELRKQKADELNGDDDETPVSESEPGASAGPSGENADGPLGNSEAVAEGNGTRADSGRADRNQAIAAYQSAQSSAGDAEKLFEALVA